MVWRLVACSLAVVLAAGPWPSCCCTATAAARTAAARTVSAPPADPTTPRCCQPKPVAADGQHPPADHPPAKCPCQGDASKTPDRTPPAASAADETARLLTLTAPLGDAEPVAAPLVTANADPGRQPPGHRLTADHLHDRHHRLRC